jgi:hypothetical protein
MKELRAVDGTQAKPKLYRMLPDATCIKQSLFSSAEPALEHELSLTFCCQLGRLQFIVKDFAIKCVLPLTVCQWLHCKMETR